ncbi:MAG: MATE family efflux transporter, partial [Clostridia bacterium]|nr:MATE family efflux transporter [Clostridia bacterium]
MGAHGSGRSVDFSRGPVWRSILAQALPLTLAQFVHLLYNVIDRIYIGHMGGDSLALTGVGLTFPIVTLIMAFTALFGNGGVPLFSIARGAGKAEEGRKIQGNALALLLLSAALLTIFGYAFRRPVLFAFGASEASYVYAEQYLNIYLIGTVFVMITTGMNGYINAQGFPKIGMVSVILGAAVNILLDPVFIFLFHMGVAGAALATVISQALSALWVLRFLFGKRALISLSRRDVRIDRKIAGRIAKLGTSSFIMQGTNCVVQIACNVMLQQYGGDLYVGVMTVLNSIREVFMLPVSGIVGGSQPVISYNFGAKDYDRTRQGIRFNTLVGAGYTLVAWLFIHLFPGLWFGIFSEDANLISTGIPLLRIYFFGFVFMSLQFAGQTAFQALGDAGHAIFFSLLRKIIIVVPLTLLLPAVGFGVEGVFLAEPVSNVIGGTACYLTMR